MSGRNTKTPRCRSPRRSGLTVDDHDLTGQTWACSLPSGGTVIRMRLLPAEIRTAGGPARSLRQRPCAETRRLRMTLKLAIRTLKFANDKTKKAASKTSSTAEAMTESKSEKEKKFKKDSSTKTVGIADLTDSTD